MSQTASPDKDRLNVIGRLVEAVCARPVPMLLLSLLFTAICGITAVTGLEFKSDRSDLISPKADFHQRWMEYCERFRETNELLILLEGPESPRLQTVDWISRELIAREDRFQNVLVHSQDQFSAETTQDFQEKFIELQTQVQLARLIAQPHSSSAPLLQLLGLTRHELNADEEERAGHALLVTDRIARSLERSLQSIDQSYDRYFPEKVTADQEFWQRYVGDPHIVYRPDTSEDGQTDPAAASEPAACPADHSIISVVPVASASSGSEKYGESLNALSEIVAAARQRFPGLEIGVTGIPQLEHEEMVRSQDDMALATLLSSTGVILLLIFGYRGLALPAVCCLTVGVSLIWTLGATTVLIGHLNILSMAFVAILVGLGIDFGIHLLSSFQDFRQAGNEVPESLARAGHTVGRGIVTAALTTAVAFLCAGLTDFPGVAELGIIAGVGVLLAVIATFMIFPAMVVLMSRVRTTNIGVSTGGWLLPAGSGPAVEGPFMRLLHATTARPVRTLICVLVPLLTLCQLAWTWDDDGLRCRVVYDSNLLNMQPRDLPAIHTQQALMRGQTANVLYAVSWYPTREEAQAYAEQFRQLSTVGEVIEMASHSPEDLDILTGKVPLPGQSPEDAMTVLEALDAAIATGAPSLTVLPHNPAEVGALLEQILVTLNNSQTVINTQLRMEVDHFLEIFARQPFEVQIQILAAAERELVRSLWSEIRWMALELRNAIETQHAYLENVTERFRSRDGDWLLQIRPSIDVWNDAGLAQYVNELRSVDTDVTGTPIQNFEASRQLKQSYLNAAVYAVLAIVLILMIDVSRPRTIVRVWPAALLLTVLLLTARQLMGSESAPELTPLRLLLAFVGAVVGGSLLVERRECVVGLMALLPPALGTGMLLGMMALTGIDFTPANLIALPLVLGIGIDDGIHVIHDFRRSRGRYVMSGNTCRALVLTSMTSIVGFGSLAFAAHRGLAGLGRVVVTGIASCLIVSVIVLPAILVLIAHTRARRDSSSALHDPADAETESLQQFAA
ncbi:MMPL family transporter [Rubinisphaera margarita]|uniref:MMPL family transporter n=1 Tax=Rubinisphaera margarita TaxID=2909586 RepID=UPI001EE8FA4E|nr:MMPL family transporter [Rubinisphaera margarita]MCG6157311.1 MMPL family transporter [Rubinisphaera margarita]